MMVSVIAIPLEFAMVIASRRVPEPASALEVTVIVLAKQLFRKRPRVNRANIFLISKGKTNDTKLFGQNKYPELLQVAVPVRSCYYIYVIRLSLNMMHKESFDADIPEKICQEPTASVLRFSFFVNTQIISDTIQ